MDKENSQLLDKLYETFPTSNKSRILEFYLNIMLVLEGARPSYLMAINPPKDKTHYDFLNIVLDIYPDTFEIFKHKTPSIFLKSNTEFITSTLEKRTIENIGISLGYCYSNSDAIDKNIIRIALSVMANQIGSCKKIQLYATCVPTSGINETIMRTIYNDILNYNKILNKYGYSVSLQTDILWLQNNNRMSNSECLK